MPAALSAKSSKRRDPYLVPVEPLIAKPQHLADFIDDFGAIQDQVMAQKRASSLNSSSAHTTPTKTKPQAWTGEELKMLFQYAIKNGAPGSDKGWEGVVPGKTGQQARNAWRFNVVPNVSKYFENK